jgi:hypothetical protein
VCAERAQPLANAHLDARRHSQQGANDVVGSTQLLRRHRDRHADETHSPHCTQRLQPDVPIYTPRVVPHVAGNVYARERHRGPRYAHPNTVQAIHIPHAVWGARALGRRGAFRICPCELTHGPAGGWSARACCPGGVRAVSGIAPAGDIRARQRQVRRETLLGQPHRANSWQRVKEGCAVLAFARPGRKQLVKVSRPQR